MRRERLSVFPAFHKVAGRPVLIVGEGAEAAAKLRLLLETEARIRLVAASPNPELDLLLAEGTVEHRRRPFRAEDLDGVVLVFAASGVRNQDAGIVAAARRRNIPANAVDLPELCDFYTPAIVNRAPVAVAITSTGAGPVLAQKLRACIEAALPQEIGALARLGESFRGAAEKVLPKGQPRRCFWSALFEGRVADAALAGRTEEARRLAARLLAGADAADQGFVWLVGAGPGAPDLLTLRAHRLLGEADVIVHDASVPDAVVAMGRRDARRVVVPDRDQNAEGAGASLVREAAAGRRVVRLAAGNRLNPGEIATLLAAGIPHEVVPGVGQAEAEPIAAKQAA